MLLKPVKPVVNWRQKRTFNDKTRILLEHSRKQSDRQIVAMELAHSLLLNEDALAQITEAKRPVFIFEWLRFLDKVLVAANKVIYETLSSL